MCIICLEEIDDFLREEIINCKIEEKNITISAKEAEIK